MVVKKSDVLAGISKAQKEKIVLFENAVDPQLDRFNGDPVIISIDRRDLNNGAIDEII